MTDPDLDDLVNAVNVLLLSGQYGTVDPALNRVQLRREVLAERQAMEKRAAAWVAKRRRQRTDRVQYTGDNRSQVEAFLGFKLADHEGQPWLVSGGESTPLQPGCWVERDLDRPGDKPFRVTRGESFDITDVYHEVGHERA
jgi:hypothetical protein